MKKMLLAGCAVLALCGQGYAETYTYACQVREAATGNTHLYSAVLDLSKHTITWRGKVYRNVKEDVSGNPDTCAKECFGNAAVRLSTATQGVADLSVGGNDFDCDLLRQ
jgi:hypothetical protein